MSPRLPHIAQVTDRRRPRPALCPRCGSRTKVVDSDPEDTGRRYRRCKNLDCYHADKPYRTTEWIDAPKD